MAADGYCWWIERFRTAYAVANVVRGFYKYREIPAVVSIAINGQWVDGPRDALFYSGCLHWEM
ncbi:MAG: 4-alpha-glucanotransferase [Roseiflexus sp.]|jgi:4-alpha-glucanotransferase|nr:4-alpha-glucanotransferase [Roseiflexus sp.]MBO9389397.1 4-alpha-glucanotransferase [Roseiflexus sp.]